MKIIIDAMGGDHAPACTVEGALEALRADPDLKITLGGDKKAILDCLGEYGDVKDRLAVEKITEQLRYAAGNFYINDKPTGAVVGNQPFGGARASGTNDKAGGEFNLIRWIIPRVIKETLVSPTDYRYTYMK